MGAPQVPENGNRPLVNWLHPRMVAAGDCEVAVHLGGRGQPVLILPGFPQSPRSFLPLAEALARDHHVIVPYLPGTGPSHPPRYGGYAIARNARRVWQVCEALGVRRFHVVGHGHGGAVAYWLALHEMRRVRRMVVLSTQMRGFTWRWKVHVLRLGFPLIADVLFAVAGPAIVRRLYQDFAGPGCSVPPDELARAVETWAPKGWRRVAPGYYRGVRNLGTWRQFHNAWIKVPTLLICGGAARGISPDSIALTAEAIEQVRVKVLPDVGHFPHLERPDEVTDLVTTFLSGRSGRQRTASHSPAGA